MAEAMWGIVFPNNAQPGLGKDRGVGLVGSASGRQYEFALAFKARQDRSRRFWQRSNRKAGFRITQPQAGIREVNLGPFEVNYFGTATPGHREKLDGCKGLPVLALTLGGLECPSKVAVPLQGKSEFSTLVGGLADAASSIVLDIAHFLRVGEQANRASRPLMA